MKKTIIKFIMWLGFFGLSVGTYNLTLQDTDEKYILYIDSVIINIIQVSISIFLLIYSTVLLIRYNKNLYEDLN